MLTSKFLDNYDVYVEGDEAELPERIALRLSETGVVKIIDEQLNKAPRETAPLPQTNA